MKTLKNSLQNCEEARIGDVMDVVSSSSSSNSNESEEQVEAALLLEVAAIANKEMNKKNKNEMTTTTTTPRLRIPFSIPMETDQDEGCNPFQKKTKGLLPRSSSCDYPQNAYYTTYVPTTTTTTTRARTVSMDVAMLDNTNDDNMSSSSSSSSSSTTSSSSTASSSSSYEPPPTNLSYSFPSLSPPSPPHSPPCGNNGGALALSFSKNINNNSPRATTTKNPAMVVSPLQSPVSTPSSLCGRQAIKTIRLGRNSNYNTSNGSKKKNDAHTSPSTTVQQKKHQQQLLPEPKQQIIGTTAAATLKSSPVIKTILRKKFSWKNYPELEAFLIANREEYLRHSALNYTIQQKQYNNRLTERLIQLAAESGYVFCPEDFSFVTVRDRIRCYFKSYVQSSKKRGLIIGYAARRAGLLTESDLQKSANRVGRIVLPPSSSSAAAAVSKSTSTSITTTAAV